MNTTAKKPRLSKIKNIQLPSLPILELKPSDVDLNLGLKKGGRPSAVTSLVIAKLETAFEFGCTDEEACHYADISMATLYRYQNKFPRFCDRKEGLKTHSIFLARQAVFSEIQSNANFAYRFLRDKRPDEFGGKLKTK